MSESNIASAKHSLHILIRISDERVSVLSHVRHLTPQIDGGICCSSCVSESIACCAKIQSLIICFLKDFLTGSAVFDTGSTCLVSYFFNLQAYVSLADGA